MNSNPLQMVRIGLGDEALNIPLYRLNYAGGQDSVTVPGGFFTTSKGEFGVAVDAQLSAEEVQELMTMEIQKNISVIAASLAARKGEKPRVPTESAPSN